MGRRLADCLTVVVELERSGGVIERRADDVQRSARITRPSDFLIVAVLKVDRQINLFAAGSAFEVQFHIGDITPGRILCQ